MVAAITIIIILSLAEPSLRSYNHCQFCVSEDLLPLPPPFCLVCFSQKMCLEGELRRALVLPRRGGKSRVRGLVGARPFLMVLRHLLLEAGASAVSCT